MCTKPNIKFLLTITSKWRKRWEWLYVFYSSGKDHEKDHETFRQHHDFIHFAKPNWQKAYDIISELTCQEGDDLNNIRAYLLCELAEKAENKEIAEMYFYYIYISIAKHQHIKTYT